MLSFALLLTFSSRRFDRCNDQQNVYHFLVQSSGCGIRYRWSSVSPVQVNFDFPLVDPTYLAAVFLISGDYFHCLLRLVPLRVFRLSILYSIFLVSFLFPASSLFRSPLDPWLNTSHNLLAPLSRLLFRYHCKAIVEVLKSGSPNTSRSSYLSDPRSKDALVAPWSRS